MVYTTSKLKSTWHSLSPNALLITIPLDLFQKSQMN